MIRVTNRIPNFSEKKKICIICEGNEEYKYFEKLLNLEVWNNKYEIELDNAGGNGNITARYQYFYQNDSYELILIFCDTEKKPYKQYQEIKRKINELFGIDDATNNVIIFGNPCTMQIIIKHWTDRNLKSPGKKSNASLIKECTGVNNYKAKIDQLESIMNLINVENYKDMTQRVSCLSLNDSDVGSSNFGKFIYFFESDDNKWIDDINSKLEEDIEEIE